MVLDNDDAENRMGVEHTYKKVNLGAEVFCHRGLKDFGCEQQPFKRQGSHLGFYHLMDIAFAAFENFKRECLQRECAEPFKL